MHHRDLDRAHLQDLRAKRRHFQHLFKGDLVHAPRLRHDARIGGVNAVNVRIDVAAVGLDRRRDGDGACVRAATSERRDPPGFTVHALKARDDGDFTAAEAFDDARAVDRFDPRRAMRGVGVDRRLPAEPRARGHPRLLQRHREKPGRHLFSRGDDGVIFALVAKRRRLLAPGDKLIGLAGHRRDHHSDLTPSIHLALHMARDIVDAFDSGDRGAAEFHNQA